MKDRAILRNGLAAAFSLAAAACTGGGDADLQVRPLAEMGDPSIRPDAVLYNQAVKAIDARDYATALDYLQAARAKDPKSARVLNAFGVVYDKLGRFDLSARYYAQAIALDPGSPTVAQNLAYSRVLQGLSEPRLAANQAPPIQIATALPAAPPVAAPTIPVVAESLAAATEAPVEHLSLAEHVAPSVDTPDRLAAAFDMAPLNFANVNIELPEEPERPAVHVAVPDSIAASGTHFTPSMTNVQLALEDPRPASPALQPLAVHVAVPDSVALSNTHFTPSMSSVRLSFEDPRPTPPALQPLAVEASALPASRPVQHATPTMSPPSVSLLAGAVSLVNLPAIPGLTPAAAAPVVAHGLSVSAVTPVAISVSKGSPFNRPLRIVNATGGTAATDPVFRGLSSLGWVVSKTRPVSAEGLKFTTVLYPVMKAPVAQALARTLPFPVRLQPDVCNCRGIQLVMGSDFLAWKPTGRRVPAVWRASLNYAAAGTNKGVR